MPLPEAKDLVFLVLAGVTILSASVVSFSRSIVYSGFALLGTFAGAAGLFALLSSDFVAVTQLLIYVGGVLVLILFAIMLTEKIGDLKLTNVSVNRKIAVPLMIFFLITLLSVMVGGTWLVVENPEYHSMVEPIGNALLTKYLLPFEVISLALVAAMVGAVVLVRRVVK